MPVCRLAGIFEPGTGGDNVIRRNSSSLDARFSCFLFRQAFLRFYTVASIRLLCRWRNCETKSSPDCSTNCRDTGHELTLVLWRRHSRHSLQPQYRSCPGNPAATFVDLADGLVDLEAARLGRLCTTTDKDRCGEQKRSGNSVPRHSRGGQPVTQRGLHASFGSLVPRLPSHRHKAVPN